MGFLGGSPSAPVYTPPPVIEPGLTASEKAAAEKAKQDEVEAQRKAAGRGSTILTGGQGLLAPPPTQKATLKTLLGQ